MRAWAPRPHLLFNSLSFALFFAVVLALHQLRAPWAWRKLALVLASTLFYAAWNPPYVLLWALTTIADWRIALALGRVRQQWLRRVLLGASLVLNLGVLFTFKYADFLLESSGAIGRALGVAWHLPHLGLVLPVGISFYTFQTLSYTVDVYRRELEPTPSLLDFSLFVSFFPQLVAGPIVRATDFLPQCRTAQHSTRGALAWGVVLLILGLFQKVILADTILSPVADALFQLDGSPSSASAWLGTFAFSAQIFCDFSGYSLCAIGAAGMLGFKLPDNFNAPYAAIGFSDFWRRWHISLSSWLRDYVYISLGGNRRGELVTQRNLLLTMLLGGLWHGASWSFVLWGGLHGMYLVLERQLGAWCGHWPVWRVNAVRLGLGLLTFFLVSLSWIPFRARELSRSLRILRALFVQSGASQAILVGNELRWLALGAIAGLLVTHVWTRNKSLAAAVTAVPAPLRVAGLCAMLWLVLMVRGNEQAFIYFQF